MFEHRCLAIVAVVVTALTAGACSSRPQQGVLVPVANSVEGTSRVNVLAATTRQRSATDAGEMFNGERGRELSYASVTVSIPPDGARKIGQVQWPSALPGNPNKDFVTVGADYLDKQAFASALSSAAKTTGRDRVLVFVHGFNNRFDDAVYRFAQIVHDAQAPAIPVLFTWPSRGDVKLRAYTYDRESANYSRDSLEKVLELIAADRNIKEVNILAHSMGNWITLETLRTMALRNGKIGAKVRAVMLVAPDVDVDVFRTQIARMGNSRPRFALFVSQDDAALAFSQTLWGGVPRLGEINPATEPYRSELERDGVVVFDLTSLKGPAHSRAFDDITTVVAMIKDRMKEEAPGPARTPGTAVAASR